MTKIWPTRAPFFRVRRKMLSGERTPTRCFFSARFWRCTAWVRFRFFGIFVFSSMGNCTLALLTARPRHEVGRVVLEGRLQHARELYVPARPQGWLTFRRVLWKLLSVHCSLCTVVVAILAAMEGVEPSSSCVPGSFCPSGPHLGIAVCAGRGQIPAR